MGRSTLGGWMKATRWARHLPWNRNTSTTIVAGVGLIMAVGVAWAIAVPERGLHDRIAGTWLVPR